MKAKGLMILVIDDNPSYLRVANKYLTSVGGHSVEVAESGLEGLRKAKERKPDIILLDLYMPGTDGATVLETLCADETTQHIPVIIITGADLEDFDRTTLAARPNFKSLEQKPVNFGELLKKISAMCEFRTEQMYNRNSSAGDALEAQ